MYMHEFHKYFLMVYCNKNENTSFWYEFWSHRGMQDDLWRKKQCISESTNKQEWFKWSSTIIWSSLTLYEPCSAIDKCNSTLPQACFDIDWKHIEIRWIESSSTSCWIDLISCPHDLIRSKMIRLSTCDLDKHYLITRMKVQPYASVILHMISWVFDS